MLDMSCHPAARGHNGTLARRHVDMLHVAACRTSHGACCMWHVTHAATWHAHGKRLRTGGWNWTRLRGARFSVSTYLLRLRTYLGTTVCDAHAQTTRRTHRNTGDSVRVWLVTELRFCASGLAHLTKIKINNRHDKARKAACIGNQCGIGPGMIDCCTKRVPKHQQPQLVARRRVASPLPSRLN